MAEIKRSIAKKISIGLLKKGTYLEKEGWEPNTIKIADQEVSRVNIIGVIIELPENAKTQTIQEQFRCTIDDGTGSIELRTFEPIPLVSPIDIATPVLIVGKPRKYNDQLYIIAEIIRPISKDWLDYRKKELAYESDIVIEEPVEEKTPIEEEKTFVENEVDEINEQETQQEISKSQTILEIIDSLDEGNGANLDDIITQVGDDAEKVKQKVTDLLLHGEIFEVKPGFMKVLK